MECHANPQSDCENCVLCAASNRVHHWRNSGGAFLDRVRQKGKTGAEYVRQAISERSKLYKEAHPKTYQILENSGHKVRNFGILILMNSKKAYRIGVSSAKKVYAFTKSPRIPSAERTGRFLIDNTDRFYYCGGAVLAIGIVSFILFCSSVSLGFCSIGLMMLGGYLIWLPRFYWWDTSRHQRRVDEGSSHIQWMSKPPQYDSLPPAISSLPTLSIEDEAPPTYEEISASEEGFLHISDCGFNRILPCALHPPAENLLTHSAQNVIDTIVILPAETSEPIVTSTHPVTIEPIVTSTHPGTTEPTVTSSQPGATESIVTSSDPGTTEPTVTSSQSGATESIVTSSDPGTTEPTVT